MSAKTSWWDSFLSFITFYHRAVHFTVNIARPINLRKHRKAWLKKIRPDAHVTSVVSVSVCDSCLFFSPLTQTRGLSFLAVTRYAGQSENRRERPRKDFNLDRARQERISRRARAKAGRILRAHVFLRNGVPPLIKFLLLPFDVDSPTNFIFNGLPSLLKTNPPAFTVDAIFLYSWEIY